MTRVPDTYQNYHHICPHTVQHNAGRCTEPPHTVLDTLEAQAHTDHSLDLHHMSLSIDRLL